MDERNDLNEPYDVLDDERDDNPQDSGNLGGIDLEGLLGAGSNGLFDAVYDMVSQSLGFDGTLGAGAFGGGDDDYDDDELPSRQDIINELTLVLLYLTSWKEGSNERRSWKSADWDALDWLREEGLVECSNKAKSVYITEEGEQVAEEALELLGLAYLIEGEDDDPDE